MNEKKPQNATTSIATSSTKNQSKYVEGEKILCYHGALIYEAKVHEHSFFFVRLPSNNLSDLMFSV